MNTNNIIKIFEQKNNPESDIIIVEKEIKGKKESKKDKINYYLLNNKNEVIDSYPENENIKIDITEINDLKEYKFIDYKHNEKKYEYEFYKFERPFIKRIGKITYRDFKKKIHLHK